jgi:hypothetical protein
MTFRIDLETHLFKPIVKIVTPIVLTGALILTGCPAPTQPPSQEQTIVVNPVEQYAESAGLSGEYVAILKPLGYDNKLDDSDKAAVDDAKNITSMGLSDNAQKVTIRYLASGKVKEYESACNLLESTSNLSFKRMHELGIDDNVVNYIYFVSSLPDKTFAKYALENALCIQDRQLTELEKSFLKSPDANSQELFDYYLTEINRTDPELAKEIDKIPDFKTMDVKKVEAIEDILGLAVNPEYKATLDSMMNIGIKEKRKYCSPLQGLGWLAEDMDFDSIYNNPMENYSLVKFMGAAWGRPAHSINSWNFDEATDRVNSPELCAIFSRMEISYASYGGEQYSPRETFERKKGNCADQARLNAYFLLKNGYEKYTSGSKRNNSVCVFEAVFDKPVVDTSGNMYDSHDVCLYTNNEGKIYFISVQGGTEGPFETEKDAAIRIAKENNRNMKSYTLKN